MTNSKLTPTQRRHLTALGHHLQPIVTIGKDGLTDGVVAALVQALEDHELVKVKVGTSSTEDRKELATRIAEPAGGEFVHMVGRTMLIFRAHPDKPKIKLPK